MIGSPNKIKIYIVFVAAALCAAVPATLHAAVNAEAELGYTSYAADVNGAKVDADSFRQRYSLLYSDNGLIGRGRVGRYRYSLGYEWASFSSKVSSPDGQTDSSRGAGHLLYQGEIRMRPPTIPLTLKAYSRDLSRTAFFDDYQAQVTDAIIAPGIAGTLYNGTHIRNGLVLGLGVKEETRRPIYKDMPRLLVDYTDSYDRDMKATSPVDSRLSFLVVSLMKGDAAFSYWRTDFKDKVNPSTYNEQKYTIGNVSYQEGRKWVDLTNWIKVSADISHTRRIPQGSLEDASTEYDLNLFAMASRDRWEMTTFNNFNRQTDRNSRSEQMNLPLFVKGTWNRDTDWQLRLQSTDSTTTTFASGIEDSQSDQIASLRVNMFRREMFTLTPSVHVARVLDSATESLKLGAGVETNSTRRFSDRYALFGRYGIEVTKSDQEGQSSSDSVRHTLVGRGLYKATDNLKLELEEQFTASTGETLAEATSSSSITAGGGISTIGGAGQETLSRHYRSTTKFSASWVPVARLRVGFVVTGDVLKQQDLPMDTTATVTNTVDYTLPTFVVGSSLSVSKRFVGDQGKTDVGASGYARYAPDKTKSSEMRLMLAQSDEDGTSTTNLELFQRYRHTIFSGAGYGRKLFDIVEELSWSKRRYITPGFAEVLDSKKRLTLGTDYFLTRNVILSATIRYSLLDPDDKKEILGSGGVAFNFDKLQATMEYTYGKRDGKTDNRTEKRFAANLRKQF
ncbi:hypothetical protein [Geobacter sp. DSM 9736]|uniref:hypothetical protein n=1 Tax=Geobacter sp. DSM 9736 TaxID=1277350 RepID=UPI000B5045A7|nr:hypothetical protein [Geobacter sp. DSM 9736]SNB46640.1 hypothetical protein SAMN06269301_2108 [Geobacter sp. DSM 9736]